MARGPLDDRGRPADVPVPKKPLRRDPGGTALEPHEGGVSVERPAAGRGFDPRAADLRDRAPDGRDRGGGRPRGAERRPETRAEKRKADAADLLAVYGVVTREKLVQEVFGGGGLAASRGLASLEREGLIERRRSAPGAYAYDVFALTRPGAAWLERRRKDRKRSKRASDDGQRAAVGFRDARQLLHDQRIFEAVQDDTRRDLESGSRIKRVRLDTEVRGLLASASETARGPQGPEAAAAARNRAARAVGLRPAPGGRVMIPDALVEIEHPDGRIETRGIEVGTSSYNSVQLAAKRSAGFRVYVPAGGGSRGGGSRETVLPASFGGR